MKMLIYLLFVTLHINLCISTYIDLNESLKVLSFSGNLHLNV